MFVPPLPIARQILRLKLRAEGGVTLLLDGLPDLLHQLMVEVDVVVGAHHRAEDLFGLDAVGEVAAAEVLAGVAGAAGVDREEVVAVATVLQPDSAATREAGARAAVPGGDHAIEHVDAAADCADDVFRQSHAHEVARLVLRHEGFCAVDRLHHQAVSFAHRDSADGITWQVALDGAQRAPLAQVVEDRALHDAKEVLVLARQRGFAAVEPPVGPIHRLIGRLAGAGVGNADVEGHHDVGAQRHLHLHRPFGRGEDGLAVLLEGELNALFGQALARQTEDLEAARIGQNRPRHRHELLHAAMLLDQLFTGRQMEVIGVRQADLRARLCKVPRRHRLHGSGRTHRHEHGRLDDASRCRHTTATRPPIFSQQRITQSHATSRLLRRRTANLRQRPCHAERAEGPVVRPVDAVD